MCISNTWFLIMVPTMDGHPSNHYGGMLEHGLMDRRSDGPDPFLYSVIPLLRSGSKNEIKATLELFQHICVIQCMEVNPMGYFLTCASLCIMWAWKLGGGGMGDPLPALGINRPPGGGPKPVGEQTRPARGGGPSMNKNGGCSNVHVDVSNDDASTA